MGITWGDINLAQRAATPDYAARCDGDTSEPAYSATERAPLTADELAHVRQLVADWHSRDLPLTALGPTLCLLGSYAPALLDRVDSLYDRLSCLEAEHSARGCGLSGALILAAAIYVAGIALGLWLR